MENTKWKAYGILTHHASTTGPPPSIHNQPNIWKLLWKLKLPHKILTFTWKLLHQAIPVKAEINRRGVHCAMTCLMCNNACETQDHIFLYCDLARAVWFGADIPIRHLTQADITVDSWVKDLIKQHNASEHSNSILHKILTLLWCIWFHRNQIMFEGKQPNPMEIILTSTSLLNRFLQNFSNNAGTTSGVRHPAQASTTGKLSLPLQEVNHKIVQGRGWRILASLEMDRSFSLAARPPMLKILNWWDS